MNQILAGPIFTPPPKPPSPLDDFDPNEKIAETWASYCPGRYNGGSFKLHRRRADMTAAMARHKWRGTIGYHMEEGRWVEVARMEPCQAHQSQPNDQPWLPHRCDRCHHTTLDSQVSMVYGRPQYRQTGSYEFVRKSGKLVEPLQVQFLCSACR